RLIITARQLGVGRFLFEATAVRAPQPEAVRWRFDGEEVQGGRTIERSFALRRQDAPHATVAVEARTGSGLRGRFALFLANESHLTRRAGHAFLPVVASQFPERRGERLVTSFTTRSLFTRPGRFERLRLKRVPCGPGEPTELVLPARGALDRLLLEPDAAGEFVLELERRDAGPDSCLLEVRLEGTAGEEPFTAMFGLTLGAPRDAELVQDAALVARIVRAQRALGRTQITAEELAAFEATDAR
ncbi:MAG: hypothetical protein ACK4N5_00305, partial [Myxococcales bacterium]